jgi:hypothetical protein
MNRTIKDATVKRYHYDSHDQLRQHLGNSSPLKISAADSRRSGDSRPTPSAKRGKTNQPASPQIRTKSHQTSRGTDAGGAGLKGLLV